MGIGKRIREARNRKSLTQEELARIIGVTKGAVANYENEASHPKEPVMYALINALDVDANFLFQDCVKILKDDKKDKFSEEEIVHIKKYRTLDGYGKEVIDRVLDLELKRCKATQVYADEAIKERRERMEAAEEQKTPTPVSEDELDDMENLLMSCTENMDLGQKQKFLEQWRKLSEQQKESSTASDPQAVDDRPPESERPDQS